MSTIQVPMSVEGPHYWTSGRRYIAVNLADRAENRRMVSSGTLRRVALVRTDVSEDFSAPVIRVTRIGEQGTKLITALTRATRRNIPEGTILYSHRGENLQSYIVQRTLSLHC
jgi:hypothetical protein